MTGERTINRKTDMQLYQTVKPGTHWWRSWIQHGRFGPVHTDNKVDRIGDNDDRDKLSNSSCCRFVAKTGQKVNHIGDSRLGRWFVAGFGQQSTWSPVCTGLRTYRTNLLTHCRLHGFTFHSMSAPMTNGLKTVTKQRTDDGSKLLILAMLPVPKNADNSKNISNCCQGLHDKLLQKIH